MLQRSEAASRKTCEASHEQDLAREIDSFRHLSHKRLAGCLRALESSGKVPAVCAVLQVRFLGACLELPNLCLVTELLVRTDWVSTRVALD